MIDADLVRPSQVLVEAAAAQLLASPAANDRRRRVALFHRAQELRRMALQALSWALSGMAVTDPIEGLGRKR